MGRSKRFCEWTDSIFNLEMLCRECHMDGLGDTLEHRREFYVRQANRYGEALQNWLNDMPDKMRLTHRLDFVT